MTQKFAERKFDSGLVAILLLAALPSIFVLLTWDLDGVLSSGGYALRYFSIPITLGQIIIVILATRKNFKIIDIASRLKFTSKFLLFIWFIFAIIPVLLVAENKYFSIFSTLQYALHGIFLAALIYLVSLSNIRRRDTLLEFYAFGAIVYIGLLLLFILCIPNWETFPWNLRLPSGTNVRQLGYFSAILAVAPISLLLFCQKRTAIWCVIVAAIVMFISWTGSRGALAGLLISPAIAALAIWRALPLRRTALLLMSFVVGMTASLPLTVPTSEFGLVRMASSFSDDDVDSGRIDVWKKTIAEIANDLWIGHGSGTFRPSMEKIYGYVFNHPHQFVLQYLYDWGLLGGGAACLLLLTLFATSLSRARIVIDASAFAAVTIQCIIVAIGSIDGALFYPMSIVLAISVVAIGLADITSTTEAEPYKVK